MDSLRTVAFEAHHAERNHHRHYEVRVGRDLLDDWTVTIRYGRTGQHGQERRYGVDGDKPALANPWIVSRSSFLGASHGRRLARMTCA